MIKFLNIKKIRGATNIFNIDNIRINQINKVCFKYIHSKHKIHHITHYKVFVDPFSHLKNIETLSSKFNLTLRINNDLIPLKFETLDLTSDYNSEQDDKCNINAHQLFDFNLNEDQTDILIEPKSMEYLQWFINKSIDIEKNQLHVILKATNAQQLNIELSNCNTRIHNSTHFKQEVQSGPNENNFNAKPIYLNPYFKNLAFSFNKCEIHFEKFDHKFVNSEYSYHFKIFNDSQVTFRKLFVYQMDCEINSSTLNIDKIMGYKAHNDETHSKNELVLKTNNSNVNIKNFVHCGKLECKSICNEEGLSQSVNNNLNFNNFSSNSFNLVLNDNDKLNLNVYDLVDNSHLKYKKSNASVRIHPLLMLSINIYEVFNQKFMSLLMMGRDGYIFCPTIIFDTNGIIKKKELMAWEMIKIKENYKFKIFVILLVYFVYKIIMSKDKVAKDISNFKIYQLFFRKTVNSYLSKIDE